MKRLFFPFVGVFALLAIGCSDDTAPPEAPKCDPACGSCQSCDTTGIKPTCVNNCAGGLDCQDEQCVAPAAVECKPACAACQMCDTAGATPTCVDICDTGLTCESGKCVAPAVAQCDPVCGDCEMCDTTATPPTCVKLCAAGLECKNKQCVAAAPADPCASKCASCERCETQYGVPICVDACADGQTCDKTKKVCRPDVPTVAFDHSTLTELAGPFTADIAGGKAVTAVCIKCHAKVADDMINTAHWKWLGDTPNVKGAPAGQTIGKRNLINNFCVAVPSNEQRCAACHASYGYKDKTFDFTAANKGAIDCLVCHATATYTRGAKTMGPDTTVDMVAAAKSVGKTTRAACGRCHFNAGGGDNVKKGDIASALITPTAAADAHMGKTTNPFTCASCHKGTAHKLLGQGVHLPVSEGRVGCTDCHGEAPHTNKMLNNHAMDIACQTCHIPAFSRQQPTKMDWDWSTAGDKSKGTGGVINTTVDGHTVASYHFMKGDFIWKGNVRPQYAWYDGGVTRLTYKDAYGQGEGTKTKPIILAAPTADMAAMTAKIFPFKVMYGRQPVDPTKRLVLVPKLFGAGGFWGAIPATFDAAVVEGNWTSAINLGAHDSGQIPAGDSYTGRGTGANQWDWAYTEMWMGINHEVAPANTTLSCTKCHGAAKTDWDWTALGYKCDPQTDAAKCGSRHP